MSEDFCKDFEISALTDADAESLVHAIPVWQFQLVYHIAGHATGANKRPGLLDGQR